VLDNECVKGYYFMPHPPVLLSEIGGGDSQKVFKTYKACDEIGKEIAKKKPKCIVLITPHGNVFSDAVVFLKGDFVEGDLWNFGAEDIKVKKKISKDLVDKLEEVFKESLIPNLPLDKKTAIKYNCSYTIDHGALIPLYFVDKYYNDYEILHITYGLLSSKDLYRAGMCIYKAIESLNLDSVIIGSGDLSHALKDSGPYTYNKDGKIFDELFIKHMENGDFTSLMKMDNKIIENAKECGLRTAYILNGCMDLYKFKGECLSYQDTFGVGYGVLKFDINKRTNSKYKDVLYEYKKYRKEIISKQSDYVKLARESLFNYLLKEEYIDAPSKFQDEFNLKNGVFVTIKQYGQLRGCIGSIAPTTKNRILEIIKNAVEAGINDVRFNKVELWEMDSLDISVSILGELSYAEISELDVKKFGVVVENDFKQGVLLPNIEGVESVEQQIKIAKQKAGIEEDELFYIKKFKVEYYN